MSCGNFCRNFVPLYKQEIVSKPDEYNDCTDQVIGCAMRVHSTLGNGFPEVIYQRALAIELEKTGLQFIREFEMPVYYDGRQIGNRKADFFVDNEIMVELKAVITLDDAHLAQALNYLEAYNVKTGLLINFGSKSLVFKRLINRKHNTSIINPTVQTKILAILNNSKNSG